MTPHLSTATAYHRATSYRRNELTPHTLDWVNQPAPVKRYPQLPRVSLKSDIALPEIDYVDLVRSRPNTGRHHRCSLDLRVLSGVVRLTHAVTARRMHGGQAFFYRSAASAGALYPCELYLGVNHVQDLNPGLYYHDLFDASLVTLRQGPVPVIPSVTTRVAATVYITGIFFRSAWKYRSRAYRYVLLDAGHLMENLRLALQALNVPFSIHLDFDDDRAAHLLGLDADREACLACVHLYDDIAETERMDAKVTSLGSAIRRASTVSDNEVAYAPILEIHRAGHIIIDQPADSLSSFDGLDQATAWTDLDTAGLRVEADYTRTLWRRRSRRNFFPEAISRERLMVFGDLMAASMGPESGMPPPCCASFATGLLIGENMPIDPGFYWLDPMAKRLGRVFDGSLMPSMASACLDQMWLKHAGLHLLFLTNMEALDRVWGARGYRYAMIEAGRLGQQAYLAATALGWGACGIGAIYDQEAAKLLGLAPDRVLLYLVGVGTVKAR